MKECCCLLVGVVLAYSKGDRDIVGNAIADDACILRFDPVVFIFLNC